MCWYMGKKSYWEGRIDLRRRVGAQGGGEISRGGSTKRRKGSRPERKGSRAGRKGSWTRIKGSVVGWKVVWSKKSRVSGEAEGREGARGWGGGASEREDMVYGGKNKEENLSGGN